MEKIVRVWVWIIVINNEWKVLIGKRKWSHWEWKFSFPWWHQEFGESVEETAIRELKEETNLDTQKSNIMLDFFTDDYMESDNKHYITLLPVIKIFSGTLKNMEPHKLEKWIWMSWDDVKSIWDNLFIPMQNFIKKYPDFDPSKI